MDRKFFITPEWEKEYYTKYPHGQSVLENLVEWASIAESMRIRIEEMYNPGVSGSINALMPMAPGIDGILGNGTDESDKLRDLIHYAALEGKTLYIPRGVVVTVESITIENKHNISLMCEGVIKRKKGASTAPLLKFSNCKNVTIPIINFNGNGIVSGARFNLPYAYQQEHKHSMSIDSCENVNIGTLTSVDTPGDVLYITGGSNTVKIGSVFAKNSETIGRNVVSIINGYNINIDSVIAENFGHYQMPGGIDLEPNNNTESINNIKINTFIHSGSGFAPLSLLSINGGTSSNIIIDSVQLTRIIPYTDKNNIDSVLISASDVFINTVTVVNESIKTVHGINVTNHGLPAENISINESVLHNVHRGLILGGGSLPTNNVKTIKINSIMKNIQSTGLYIIAVDDAKLNLDIDRSSLSYGYITKSGGNLCSNIIISGNISKRNQGPAAVLTSDDKTTISGWVFENLDFTGWKDNERMLGSGLSGDIKKINCKNLTHLPARPKGDQWHKGDFIYNISPVEMGDIGSKYIVDKWIILNDGPGSINNTAQSRVLTGN